MGNDYIGKGWKLDVGVNSKQKIRLTSPEEEIKEAIYIILSTKKGERVMRPNFGCGIHTYVFSIINTATLTLIENDIRESLTKWEPRIELKNIIISTENIENGELSISIDYLVKNSFNEYNLVYPFYVKEV